MKITVNEASSATLTDYDFVTFGSGTNLLVFETLEDAFEYQKKELQRDCTFLRVPKNLPLDAKVLGDKGASVFFTPHPGMMDYNYSELKVPGLSTIRLGRWGEPIGPTYNAYLIDGQWVREKEARRFYSELLKSTK